MPFLLGLKWEKAQAIRTAEETPPNTGLQPLGQTAGTGDSRGGSTPDGGDAGGAEPPYSTRAVQPGGWLPLALLLTGPLLVNGISLMLAVMVYLKAAETTVPRDLLWLGFSYYLGYAVCSYVASRKIPPHLAPLAVRGSLLALGALSFFLASADGFATYVVFSALNGGIIGFYFAPLQIAMGGLKPCKTVAWTIAFYNVSWGTGAAFGPFVSGWLRELGSPAAATPEQLLDAVRLAAAGGSTGGGWSREAVVGTVVGASILLHLLLDWPVFRNRKPVGEAQGTTSSRQDTLPAKPDAATATAPFASTANLRRIGFAGAAVVTILRTGLLTTLWPALSEQQQLSAAQKGWGLLLLGLPVPLLAPLWAGLHRRFDRPWLSLLLLAVGAAGVGMLPFVGWQGQLVGLTAVGTAVSGLIYLAVFYANSDPRWPSASVGVTEFFIGAGGLIGPMVLGWLAGSDARAALPYLAGAGLAAGVAVGVAVIGRRIKAERKEQHR